MTSFPSDPGSQRGSALERERISQGNANDVSIAELLSGIVADAQHLVRREIDLAKREVSIEIDKVKQGSVLLGAGIGLAAVGGILLSFMLVYVLVELLLLPLWLSHLIIGGIFTIVGALLLLQGVKRMRNVDPVPRETIESVKEDIQWIKEQSPSDRT